MSMVTRKQLAAIRGVTVGAVYKKDLPMVDGKKYDLSDPDVRAWVVAPYLKIEIDKLKNSNDAGQVDLDALKAEKIKAAIDLQNKQGRKLDLQFALEKQDLVPGHELGLYLGFFKSAIEINILTIARRVARGNRELERRIDAEATRAIEKTKEYAKTELRKHAAKVAKIMEAAENAKN